MRKNVTQKLMSMLLSIALFIGLLSGITMVSEPITADAAPALLDASQPVTYIYRDENNISGEIRTCSDYTLVTSDNLVTQYTAGWYVFQGNAEFDFGVSEDSTSTRVSRRLEVEGDVNIILMDDCRFYVPLGIHIKQGAHLNIYGQQNDSGQLRVGPHVDVDPSKKFQESITYSAAKNSPLGGNRKEDAYGASLTINGGYVSAQGLIGAAGIGAGKEGTFGCITINGGTVTAKGGQDAAGIGGGDEGGQISTITINNGIVSSWGYEGGAGIGGGADSADGGSIIINGGNVEAIGGGARHGSGGIQGEYDGAGIGGGKNRTGPNEITITGGYIVAYGTYNGAGIGGGGEGNSGNITITGGEITAVGGEHSAGIGGGSEAPTGIGNGKRVLITGGKIKAIPCDNSGKTQCRGAGIGGGAFTNQGGDIIIKGGEVLVEGVYGAGIGGGGGYQETHPGGNVIISGGTVSATSHEGAGIGGGGATSFDKNHTKGRGGDVTISGGEVYASSFDGGAAIGGAAGCDGGNLTITGGYVVAITSSVTYDWVNNVNPKHAARAGQDFAAVFVNWICKKAFSNPVQKSPAAIGGGFDSSGYYGEGGTFKMTGGTLLAKSALKDVGAIGGGSGSRTQSDSSIADNLSIKYTDDIKADPGSMQKVTKEYRQARLLDAPYIIIGECEHNSSDYTSTQHGHTCQCNYCDEHKKGEQPHHWDASGMTCEDCGYKRTDGLSVTFVNQDESYLYTGEEIRPEVKVSLSGKSLTAGTDYDVTYSNNTTVGMAKITVAMKGENSGLEPFILSFEIENAPIDQVDLSSYIYPYDGSSHPRPGVSAKSGGRTVDPSEYEINPPVDNQTNAGSYLITLEAKDEGNYEGSFMAMWSIAPREIKQDDNSITCNIESTSYTYDGTSKTPQVTVTDNGLASGSPKELVQDKDYTVTYKNNINAGEGTVIITGQGNYTGTVEKTFTIEKATITRVDFNKQFFPYTGNLHKVSVLRVVAEVNGKTLEVPLNECIISGDTGINAGTYSLKIDTLDSSNFKYGDPFNWYIRQKVLTDYAALYSDEYIYTGSEIQPAVRVTDGDVMLKEGQDYTLEYENNTSVGEASVKVTLKGNYYDSHGPKTLPFTIKAAGTLQDITKCNVELLQSEYTYDRTAKKPDVTVKDGDTTLTKDTNYTVEYFNNTEVGTAIAVVKGTGDYRGAITSTYTITPAQIGASDITATLSETEYIYDGNEKMPYVTVKDSDTILKGIREDSIDSSVEGEASLNGYDYTYKYENNKNAGEATVTITGNGNYTGTRTLTFNISKAKIDMAELSEYFMLSSGGYHEMTLFASADGMMLPKNAFEVTGDVDVVTGEEEQQDNYSVSLLAKNGGIGNYSVTVTAKSDSNYEGSVTIPFYIVEDGTSLFDAQLLETRYIYDGNAKKPDVVVTGEKGILTEDKDYTLEYRDNDNAGTAAVVVTGKGNYHGSRTLFYTIEKAQLDVVNISDPVLTYTGKEQTVGVLSVFADKSDTFDNYVPAENYIVSGNKAKDVGTYQLTVTAKDNSNYRGAVSVPYSIVSQNDKVFTAQLESYETTYDGTAKEPVVTVTGDTELTKDTDYTVTYQDNVDAGIARVFVSGKGDYEGTRVLQFRINKAPLQSVQLEGDSALTYNGDYQTVNVKEVKAGDDSVQTPITVPDEAYSITGDTVRSPGEYTLKATAKTHSNFTGEATTSFEIKPNNSALWMDIQDTEFIYNGKEQKPIVYIYDGDERLTQGEDYNIEYSDNVNAGAGMIKVTYLGKYAGGDVDVYSCSFAIEKATPTITTLPTASKVTSGQTLADSTLRGGKATVDGKTIQGQFEWEDSTIAPDVSDSDAEYTVKFIPTDNANYSVVTCEVKLGAKSVTPTPVKPTAYVKTAPTANTLTYNGKPQELVTAGEATGGTMLYALGTDSTTAPKNGWSAEVPTGTDAGSYFVWYKVVGDNNHEDIEPSYVGMATIIENHSDNVLSIDEEKGIATVRDDVSGGTEEVPLDIITEGLLYRMYDPNRGEHFFTKILAEVELLLEWGWIHESGSDSTVVSATDEDAMPVYRLYNPNEGGMHFYTDKAEEVKFLESVGWNYEGISYYVYKPSSTKGKPQHRLYNPNSPNGEHIWLEDEAGVNMLIEAGWVYEGICWRIV